MLIFSNRLKILRTKNKLTQEQLADEQQDVVVKRLVKLMQESL